MSRTSTATKTHDTKTGQPVVTELLNPDSTAAQTGGEHVDRHTYPTPRRPGALPRRASTDSTGPPRPAR
ncbi:hypothetical protein ACFSVK_02835 [Azorhizophilus paspali]|uniref:hypothetical protein n=1 Tax=Azorhizophilus paspali TaxID=69963 RepID=UPI003642FEDE